MGNSGQTEGQPLRHSVFPSLEEVDRGHRKWFGYLRPTQGGRWFLLFVIALQGFGLFLPLVSASFDGAAHTGALFLLTFVSAMAAILWRGLAVSDMPLVPLFLVAFEVPLWGVARVIGVIFWSDMREFAVQDMGGAIWRSLLLQSFTCTVVAVAVLIRSKSQAFHVRKAADDFEEQRFLFDMLVASNPQRDISFFKMQRVHERSRCIVGVDKGKTIGSVCMLLWNDAIYLFDFSWTVGASRDIKERFVRAILDRPENLVPLRIALVSNPVDRDVLAAAGFDVVDPTDIDANLLLQKGVTAVRIKDFPDWAPLAGFPIVMKFLSNSPVDAA